MAVLLHDQQVVRCFRVTCILHQVVRHHRKADKVGPVEEVFPRCLVGWIVEEGICGDIGQ